MNKVVISGVCGTIGSALLEYLSNRHKGLEIVGFDINENGIHLLSSLHSSNQNVTCLLADLRDKTQLASITEGASIVFHVAARKHVGVCEYSPSEAIATNIEGLQNLISVCESNIVPKFLFTSSDKAVNPTNVMGTTKLLGEKIVTSAHYRNQSKGLKFSSTRFGNVMGSSGSVIPIFARACLSGEALPVTSVNMTRFMMSIDESVNLIVKASEQMSGGEIIITKMPCVNILTLAKAVHCLINNKSPDSDACLDSFEFIETGIRTGEKLYEELMNTEELSRSYDCGEFILIKPAYDLASNSNSTATLSKITNIYNSAIEESLDLNSTVELIKYLNLSDMKSSHIQYNWP